MISAGIVPPLKRYQPAMPPLRISLRIPQIQSDLSQSPRRIRLLLDCFRYRAMWVRTLHIALANPEGCHYLESRAGIEPA